jgi:hypothetical protein
MQALKIGLRQRGDFLDELGFELKLLCSILRVGPNQTAKQLQVGPPQAGTLIAPFVETSGPFWRRLSTAVSGRILDG